MYRTVLAHGPHQREEVRRLDRILFSTDDALDTSRGEHWLVWSAGVPVAFSSVKVLSNDPGTVWRLRSGVLKEHRGHGLQRRLIRASQLWTGDIGMKCLIGNTAAWNHYSAVNFFRCGFQMFDPHVRWMAGNTIYWRWFVGNPTHIR